jgi:small-conductance mechanosensitive channel
MIRIRTAAAVVTLTASGAFFIGGPYMVYRGFDARSQVRAELKAEHIVTPEDASKPGIAVVDGPSAVVQANIIKKHTLETTGGKSYAQLDRTDPARTTAFQGDMLRTALLSSALAWNVANLVIGLGVLVTGLGVVALLVGLAIRKPEQLLLTANADMKEAVDV